MSSALIYLRSLMALISFGVLTVVLSCIVIVLKLIFPKSSVDEKLIQFWAVATCFLFGVKVELVGDLQNLPQQGALYYFSHSSFFDIVALVYFFPYLHFGAKVELFKVPFFGRAMKKAGMLPIARKNKEQVFKIYEEASARFQKGESFALSAEGGRFYNQHLSTFKSGPVVFALKAQAPIVPLVLLGAYEVWPKGQILPNTKAWSSVVRIHILPVVHTAGFGYDDRHAIADKIYPQMDAVWNQHFAQKFN